MHTGPYDPTVTDPPNRNRQTLSRCATDKVPRSAMIVVVQLLALAWAMSVIFEIRCEILGSFCGTCKGPAIFSIVIVNPALAVLSCAATVYLRYRDEPVSRFSRLLTYLLVSIAIAPYIALGDVAHCGTGLKRRLVRHRGAGKPEQNERETKAGRDAATLGRVLKTKWR